VEEEAAAAVYAAEQGKYAEHAHISSSSSRYRSKVRPRARYPAEFARVRDTLPSSREFAPRRESARAAAAAGDEASSSADLMQQQQRQFEFAPAARAASGCLPLHEPE
jgi:hypothetical protein